MLPIAILVLASLPLLAAVVFAFLKSPHKWRGKMLCRACGYRWKTRQATPARKCGKCWDENVVPVSEAEPGGITTGGMAARRS